MLPDWNSTATDAIEAQDQQKLTEEQLNWRGGGNGLLEGQDCRCGSREVGQEAAETPAEGVPVALGDRFGDAGNVWLRLQGLRSPPGGFPGP